MNKLYAPLLACSAALALSACGTLIPPRHLSQQDVAGLTAGQLAAARRYQGRIPAAESRVDAATRRYETAQAQYTVAKRYAAWKHLAQEVAVTRRNLAQAHVSLLQRRVQLARAQALAKNSSPKQAKQLHVDRYQARVHEQAAVIKNLQHTLGQLRSLAASAKGRFETAKNNLGGAQLPASPSRPAPRNGAKKPQQGPSLQTQPLQSSG